MKNSSGFYGYSLASVYPDMGDQVTQTLATVPDVEEQEALSGQEPEKRVSPAVANKSRSQVWMVLIALVAIVFIFGIPKG